LFYELCVEFKAHVYCSAEDCAFLSGEDQINVDKPIC